MKLLHLVTLLWRKYLCWSKLYYWLPLWKFDACNARKANRYGDEFTKWRILSMFFETELYQSMILGVTLNLSNQ